MIILEAIKNVPDYNGIGVYALIDDVDGKRYIGSSKNIRKRIRQHDYALRKGMASKKLSDAYSKGHTFTFELIEKIDYGHNAIYVCERELYYINLFDSVDNGLNTAKTTTTTEEELKEWAGKNPYYMETYIKKIKPIYKDGKINDQEFIKKAEASVSTKVSFSTTVYHYNSLKEYAENKGKEIGDILSEFIVKYIENSAET